MNIPQRMAGFSGLRWLYVLPVFALLSAVSPGHGQGFLRTVTTGLPTPFDVAAADFDGDGDIDAAVSSSQGNTVYWVEVEDSAATLHPVMFTPANGPRGLTAGDFDSDGDVDLVVASYGDDRFIRLDNIGGGGENQFAEYALLDQANGAWAAETGDLDGDGDDDLVTAEYLGNVVRILIQENGILEQRAALSVPNPLDISLADWDSDGDSDVLCAAATETIRWIEQVTAESWTLQALTVGNDASCVAAADLDGDQDLDLAAGMFSGGVVAWWERQSATQFVQHTLSTAMLYVRAIGISDLDVDGNPDITASAQSGNMRWWRNGGNRTFMQRTMEGGAALYGLTLVDQDQDSDPDVWVTDFGAGQVVLYRNTMGTPGVLSGIVRSAVDDTPLPGIRLRLLETSATTTSGAGGAFRLLTAPGTFTVRSEHPCWNSALSENVVVTQAETTWVDIDLTRPVIELEQTSLNLVVPGGMISEHTLPLYNRGDGPLTLHTRVEANYPETGWLTVEPESAVVAAGETLNLVVHVAPGNDGDGPWDYYGIFSIASDACPDSMLQVAVLAYVLDAPEREAGLPVETKLLPAYPNPFNAVTTLSFEVAQTGPATLQLFDLHGRLARTLFTGSLERGTHSLRIAADELASGVYLLRLEAGPTALTQKLLLIK